MYVLRIAHTQEQLAIYAFFVELINGDPVDGVTWLKKLHLLKIGLL